MDEMPTASCLLYLFADRWLPGLSLGKRLFHETAVPTPATGTPVDLRLLEDHLLAVALWDLAATELITLDDSGKGHDTRRYRLSSTGGDRPALRGIEGHVLHTLPEDGSALLDLLADRWLPSGWTTLPLNVVVLEAQLEAAELGLIDTPTTPDLTASGHYHFPSVDVDADRLGRLREALDHADYA